MLLPDNMDIYKYKKQWFESDLMSAYLDVLQARLSIESEYQILPTCFINKQAKKQLWHIQCVFSEMDQYQIKKSKLCSAVSNGVHWITYCLDRETREIRYYNGLKQKQKEQAWAEKAVSTLIAFLDPDDDAAAWKHSWKTSFMKQRDGYNCGPIALFNVEKLCSMDNPLFATPQIKIGKYRQLILKHVNSLCLTQATETEKVTTRNKATRRKVPPSSSQGNVPELLLDGDEVLEVPKIDSLVFATFPGYSPWPARVLSVWFDPLRVNVMFLGTNNTATLRQAEFFEVNEDTVERFRCPNKKILGNKDLLEEFERAMERARGELRGENSNDVLTLDKTKNKTCSSGTSVNHPEADEGPHDAFARLDRMEQMVESMISTIVNGSATMTRFPSSGSNFLDTVAPGIGMNRPSRERSDDYSLLSFASEIWTTDNEGLFSAGVGEVENLGANRDIAPAPTSTNKRSTSLGVSGKQDLCGTDLKLFVTEENNSDAYEMSCSDIFDLSTSYEEALYEHLSVPVDASQDECEGNTLWLDSEYESFQDPLALDADTTLDDVGSDSENIPNGSSQKFNASSLLQDGQSCSDSNKNIVININIFNVIVSHENQPPNFDTFDQHSDCSGQPGSGNTSPQEIQRDNNIPGRSGKPVSLNSPCMSSRDNCAPMVSSALAEDFDVISGTQNTAKHGLVGTEPREGVQDDKSTSDSRDYAEEIEPGLQKSRSQTSQSTSLSNDVASKKLTRLGSNGRPSSSPVLTKHKKYKRIRVVYSDSEEETLNDRAAVSPLTRKRTPDKTRMRTSNERIPTTPPLKETKKPRIGRPPTLGLVPHHHPTEQKSPGGTVFKEFHCSWPSCSKVTKNRATLYSHYCVNHLQLVKVEGAWMKKSDREKQKKAKR